MTTRDHLASPGFQRLWERVRRRIERDPGGWRAGSTRLDGLDAEERRALGGLLGRHLTGPRVTLRLADLDAALHLGTARGLLDWLEDLGAPLRDRPGERESAASAVEQALETARRSPLAGTPWFRRWLEELEAGALARMEREGSLDRLGVAVATLEALPAADSPIALFASRNAGGTKALDGTPLERLVLRAIALWQGETRPANSEERRLLWERVGVVPDDLASHVLVLNLSATGDGPVDGFLRACRAEGLPARLTLQQLVRVPPAWIDERAFVCENPAVLRLAAERLGPRSAPLIATEGRPSLAFWRLLACGGPRRLLVHADFDAAGLEIAGSIIERAGAEPWRFDRASWQAAAGENVPLPAVLPDTPWDPTLGAAMAGGPRVEEEQVVEGLIADLDAGFEPSGAAPGLGSP